MKCKQVQELAGAYLYGDLAPQEMRAVRMHAQECRGCREDLRARGAVAASIPNDAPQLSDEERQQILWSVKGAVRAERPARFGFRFSPAYALAAAAVLAVVGIKVVGSLPHTQSSHPRATVRVTEELTPAPTKDSNVTAKNNDNVDEKSTISKPHERRRIRLDIVNSMSKRLPIAVYSRDHQNKRPAVAPQEPPAPVVDPPSTPDVKEKNGDTKLPKPNESNNVQKSPPEPETPADNSGETNTSNP